MLKSNIKLPLLLNITKSLPKFSKKDKQIFKTIANAIIYPIIITLITKNILLGFAFIALMAVLYPIKYKKTHYVKTLFFNIITCEISIILIFMLLIVS